MSVATRDKTAIVDVGSAGVGEVPDYSAIELFGQALLEAVVDTGLKLSDIGAILAATSSHAFPILSVTEYLGIRLKFVDGTSIGGPSPELHLLQATLVLEVDLCDAVLTCHDSNQRTTGGRLVSMSEPQWHETPYKPCHLITAYALAASQHMYQYGTIHEQLIGVVASARQWASLNPETFVHGPLNVDDVPTAQMISDPLSAVDCCLVTDGGGACVVVHAGRVRDLSNAPMYSLSVAGMQWCRSIVSIPDLTVIVVSKSAPRATQMAGVRHTGIDLAILYDAFTTSTLLFLEGLGSHAKGEGGPSVQGGRIASGGELAASTNGGGLSCAYPGMHGMFLIIEAVTQLHCQAGERQLVKVDMTSLHGNGSMLSSQVAALLDIGDTLQTLDRQAFRALPWRRPTGVLAHERVVAPTIDKRIR